MKMRMGFVSNSSSSSFMIGLVTFRMEDKSEVDEFVETIKNEFAIDFDHYKNQLVVDSVTNLREKFDIKLSNYIFDPGLKISENEAAVFANNNNHDHVDCCIFWNNWENESNGGIFAFWFNDIIPDMDDDKYYTKHGYIKVARLSWFPEQYQRFYKLLDKSRYDINLPIQNIELKFGVGRHG